MINQEIAGIFSTMADILEFKKDNIFKIRAYRRAALIIGGLPRGANEISREELLEIPGIGVELTAKIEEYVQTGSIHGFEKMKEDIPEGLLTFLAVPGLRPKTARLLYELLHVTTLDELEQAALEHPAGGYPRHPGKERREHPKGDRHAEAEKEWRPFGRVFSVVL